MVIKIESQFIHFFPSHSCRPARQTQLTLDKDDDRRQRLAKKSHSHEARKQDSAI